MTSENVWKVVEGALVCETVQKASELKAGDRVFDSRTPSRRGTVETVGEISIQVLWDGEDRYTSYYVGDAMLVHDETPKAKTLAEEFEEAYAAHLASGDAWITPVKERYKKFFNLGRTSARVFVMVDGGNASVTASEGVKVAVLDWDEDVCVYKHTSADADETEYNCDDDDCGCDLIDDDERRERVPAEFKTLIPVEGDRY